MLCCCGVPNGPTGFWSVAVPVYCSNKFILLKTHTTKHVRALRESVYTKRKRKGTEYWSCTFVMLSFFYNSFSFTLWYGSGERKWKVAQSDVMYSWGPATDVVVGSLSWVKVASWVVAKALYVSCLVKLTSIWVVFLLEKKKVVFQSC